MMSAIKMLETTIWGGWENVPPIRKREIGLAEYQAAKRIVNEYECKQIAHEGHYQCTDVDCIL